MIDMHLHIGQLGFGDDPLTAQGLLKFMDQEEIDRAVLLPIESPECTDYYVTTTDVMAACEAHPDRFIPFCNVDPRRNRPGDIIRGWHERGCLGYGEAMSGLRIDDPMMHEIYATCGELSMPIVYDIDQKMNLDNNGLPGLESVLRSFPNTTFIGHGPCFWAEISGDYDRATSEAYPGGPVTPGGAVPRLMETYDNLWADISAGSGLNALGRDPAFGDAFLTQFSNCLLFGTDLCHSDQKIAHARWLRQVRDEGRITREVFDSIAEENALRLLKLD